MKQISAAKWHEDNSAIFPSLQGVSHSTAAQSSSDNMATVNQPTYIQLLTLSFIQSDAKVWIHKPENKFNWYEIEAHSQQ